MPYQNYHRHSHISNIIVPDSVVTNEDYCKRAVELGHSIISSCEHGTQGDYRECATLAEKYNLKWRYVTEAYFVIDRQATDAEGKQDGTNAHMILAAKTEKGIGDLNELLSEANLTGYYGRPRIDLELVMALDPADVFITTACLGGVFKYGWDEAERIIRTIESRFHGSFMLEIQYHNTEKQKEVNRFLLRMYRKYNIPLIMGTDSHYILPEDAEARDKRLEANGLHYDDEEGFYMDYPADDVAYERFMEQGIFPPALIREAMDNTNIFLEFEDVVLDKSKKLPNIYKELTQEERNALYKELVHERWEAYKKTVPEEAWSKYEDGIRYEVDTITSTDMSDYFLIDYNIVKRAKELGGMLTDTGRGSGPSYFTNTLLGFSSMDRMALPVTMYPDRFISKDRLLAGSMPDLDLNCGDVAPFAQAQAEVMGEWRSAPMIAFGTMKRSAAWKMYCRANDVEFEIANAISESLKEYEDDYKYADDAEREELDVCDYVPLEYQEYLEKSESYLGVINSISPHPCAYVLCTKDIRREIGIFRINSGQGAKKKTVFAAFITGATADSYGYLKNDLLKVTVVKVNAETYKRAGIKRPSVPELLGMTRDDNATWDMYSKGYTLGLNQVEKEKSTEKVMRYKPRNISEMSAFVAAIRPAFQSMVNVFLDRKRYSFGIETLDKLLQTPEMPDSFIMYQEQMMAILQYGGFTASDSYKAIKAIAKKHPEKVLPLKARFIDGFMQRLIDNEGVSQDAAESTSTEVWTIISDACSYLFNSSHAISVACDSLYGAYAKAHYPYEFYATLLENYSDKGDKKRISKAKVEMAKAFGIHIAPCKFRQDNRGFYIDKENHTISDSLASIKHVSKRAACALYELRDKQYDSFIDLLVDLEDSPALNARTINVLIQTRYFDEFGGNRKLLNLYKEFKEGRNRYSKSHKDATKQKRLAALRELEKSMLDEELTFTEQLTFETEHYTVPISTYKDMAGHFVILEVDDKYSPKLRMYNVASGTVGVMKVRKPYFKKNPVQVGNVIFLDDWTKAQAVYYANGQRNIRPGVYDLWIKAFHLA